MRMEQNNSTSPMNRGRSARKSGNKNSVSPTPRQKGMSLTRSRMRNVSPKPFNGDK